MTEVVWLDGSSVTSKTPASADPVQVPFDTSTDKPIDLSNCNILLHLEDLTDSNGSLDGTNSGSIETPGWVGDHGRWFDGNDHISCPDTGLPSGADARTIMFWVFPYDITISRQMLLGWGTGNTGQASGIRYANYHVGGLEWVGWGAGDGHTRATVTPRAWSHVAVTYDGTDMKFYVNGALQTTFAVALSTVLNGTFYLGWGQDGTSYKFKGALDEVVVIGECCTAAQILQVYDDQKWRPAA